MLLSTERDLGQFKALEPDFRMPRIVGLAQEVLELVGAISGSNLWVSRGNYCTVGVLVETVTDNMAFDWSKEQSLATS